MENDSLSEWMAHVRTVLCQNNPRKGSEVENLAYLNGWHMFVLYFVRTIKEKVVK